MRSVRLLNPPLAFLQSSARFDQRQAALDAELGRIREQQAQSVAREAMIAEQLEVADERERLERERAEAVAARRWLRGPARREEENDD